MKLKDKNDVVQMLIEDSFRELSREMTKVVGHTVEYSYWSNNSFLDEQKNKCFRAALDVSIRNDDGKVTSFKVLIDRALVLRDNIGTKEEPKYGKQKQSVEEYRRIVLSEIVGKGVASLVLELAQKTKEQIEEFNQMVPENLKVIPEDVLEFEKLNSNNSEIPTD